MNRPNILLLLSDQQRADSLGIVNPAIRTPHLDRLAAEGLHCQRAYPATPVCLPCRTSMLTGQYPSVHGATHNHAALPESHFPMLPKMLSQVGYATHLIGKSHFTSCHDPCSRESAPFIHNREYYRRWKGPWFGFERATISIGHSTEKHACGMHYGAWLEDQGVDTTQYFGHTSYEGYGKWDLPEQFHSSKWVADSTIQGIDQAGNEGRPFFIWANFPDPHNPCYVPEPWYGMYDPESLPLHGFKPGEPESFKDKPPFYLETLGHPGDYASRYSDPDSKGPYNVSHFNWSERQIRENTACYYSMVTLMDHHIGRILEHLERLGIADNTLIVFASDHGDLLGDHGLWWKGMTAFEECQRVPMLVRYPGHVPCASTTQSLQNLIDLAPTFARLAGAPLPHDLHGVDQMPAWTNPGHSVRDYTVIEERPDNSAFTQRTYITHRHKLCVYANRPYGELYDLEADPNQIENLWNREEYRTLKEELIQRLLSHEMTKGKPLPVDSGRIGLYEEFA